MSPCNISRRYSLVVLAVLVLYCLGSSTSCKDRTSASLARPTGSAQSATLFEPAESLKTTDSLSKNMLADVVAESINKSIDSLAIKDPVELRLLHDMERCITKPEDDNPTATSLFVVMPGSKKTSECHEIADGERVKLRDTARNR